MTGKWLFYCTTWNVLGDENSTGGSWFLLDLVILILSFTLTQSWNYFLLFLRIGKIKLSFLISDLIFWSNPSLLLAMLTIQSIPLVSLCSNKQKYYFLEIFSSLIKPNYWKLTKKFKIYLSKLNSYLKKRFQI